MNINIGTANASGSGSFFVGNSILLRGNGLKSTQEKLQRQQERDNKIAFYENQKSSLKNMECGSLEEISRKLELFHSYEDQIAAAKEEYNNSQMFHAMDEAQERGEKIAEERKKHEPKTAEERREEMAEEALGTDEEKGLLTESMEELEELTEEVAEELTEELTEEVTEELTEEIPQTPSEEIFENFDKVQKPEGNPERYIGTKIDFIV